MAIPEAYVNNVGNLAKFLEEIRSAGVPDRVTFEFLKTLGFTSSNDRPIISVLKGIGFLDQNGSPTDAYKAYRDHNEGPKVLANSLRSAYADLFLANTKANDLPVDKLKGIIATKVSKGEQVVKLIASLHGINPLAWLAAARVRAERELAFDGEVLASSREPADYTRLLTTDVCSIS